MARGKRETFLLNPNSRRDKVIIDFLDKEFNRSETIRDILYQYVVNNHDEDIKSLPYHKSDLIGSLKGNGNNRYNDDCNNRDNNGNDDYNDYDNTNNHYNDADNKHYNDDYNNRDNTFNIDLNSIDDGIIGQNLEDENKNANDAALDYLKNFR